MEEIFRNRRYKSVLAIFCAFGWSLAYPLIKIGYQEFQIASADLGGKILFAGIRFLFAGMLVSVFCRLGKRKLELENKNDLWWLILLAIVNVTFHYMFAYIGLGYNPSARSTILDSMGGFFLIILSTIIFSDDKISVSKMLGCVLGIAGIVSINIQPGANFFENITFRGDGMILLNAGCAALGGVITRVTSKKMNMMRATGQSMMFGGALLLVIGLMAGTNSSWCVDVKGMIVLIVLIMISAVCFAIYNQLLAYHPISEIAIFNALIPVLGVIFSALLLKERLKWQYFIAVMMVAFGIYLVNKKEHSE
ncbi:MAG: DMT family transporter [Frisingicoccus sp.]|uniref:DMT family transporter n=1 Tax=Frisingicoccus sp. TaxID=1918627 RepID=UPI002A8371FF|nr:DMT family transporter [Frisingicoccus sp.]MDY4836071.1 DMT family transporter [Frisingicoccus sp.]